jgi:hypothetical protein
MRPSQMDEPDSFVVLGLRVPGFQEPVLTDVNASCALRDCQNRETDLFHGGQ